ncbi:uncharacterized protein Pyn_22541 [Prunus yedoensis var. nudiflora]|uniref:C2 domain-containing protein n=1 Tax=Prunus yedoensis var. nudiflora TaxID=2094558 RepID=A0A314ZNH5_PRUYE|nr:uncharacterized protein Pyn_22541 [Prunus yedoensis var. nudiflora]
MPRPPLASSFQLLEINLISAQDLYPASKSMRTFAVAWVNPKRKLTTRVDQNGHTNPTWNEKFVFRVDDDFLKDDTSKIMIEIYASAWLRDVLIGTAAVVVNNLQNKSKMRFMAIQLRRPSGRPQGILNIGLGLLDNTMRSMPLYSELSSSAVGYWDLIEGKGANQKNHDPNYKDQDKFIIFQRSQSDRTGSDYGFSKSRPASSICDGLSKSRASSSICNAATGGFSKTTKPQERGKGGSICSDVGPSPSVVAAAIAKGIYPLGHGGGNVVRHAAKGDARNSLLDEWTDQDSVEGLKTKIERWRTELPPVYDCKNKNNNNNNTSQHPKLLQSSHHGTNRPPKSRRSRSSGKSLFSCFALGCELSISCGGEVRSLRRRVVARLISAHLI